MLLTLPSQAVAFHAFWLEHLTQEGVACSSWLYRRTFITRSCGRPVLSRLLLPRAWLAHHFLVSPPPHNKRQAIPSRLTSCIPPVKRAVHFVAYLSSWQKPFPKLHTFCPEPSSIATLQAAAFRNRPPMTECIVRCRIFSAQLVLQLTAFPRSQSSAPRLPCWRYVPWAFQEPDASPLMAYRTSKAAICLAQSEFNVLMTGH